MSSRLSSSILKKLKLRAEAVDLKLVNNITSCAGRAFCEGGHNSEDIIITHKG